MSSSNLDRVCELEANLAELRRLDEARTEFVSLVSHELRAPTAVVHGIAATLHLRGDEIPGDQLRELRRMLFDHTARLATLVEQLLDLSRLDAGAYDVEPQRFRPRERIDELVAHVAPDRLADVHVDVAPDFELVTDAHGFERVISNLIENALRYGEPPVEVHAEPDDRVKVVVEDRGPGIPPEFVPRLFDRFSQVDPSPSERGAGLGLAIARSFAQALGGDIRYAPARPRGACFTFELPRDRGA